LARKLIGGRSTEAYRRLYQSGLSKGDYIVLHITGEGKIKGFCSISGDYKFDNSKVWPIVNGETYPHRRSIELNKVYERSQEPDISTFYGDLEILEEARNRGQNLGSSFGLFLKGITPKEIREHDFKVLYESKIAVEKVEEESGEYAYSLSVEKDLESYLINNLDHIETGLKPYKSTEEARQYNTDIGRIDILAIDKNSKLVVIELKAGEADRQTLGQIIPYVSWVKTNIANGEEVRGLVIANSFDYRVIQALEVLPFLGLIRYQVEFKFEKAG